MGKLFRTLIATLIFDYNWQWLEQLIIKLCLLEVNIAYVAGCKHPLDFRKIPKGFYCYEHNAVCPFWTLSRVARFFFGHQCSGFCYLLGKGDFNSGTDILWDQCKCCGINDEEEPEGDNDDWSTFVRNLEL